MILSAIFTLSTIGIGFADRLGVEVDDRPSAFVDLAKRTREFQNIGKGDRTPVDSSGWPKGDCFTVLFDNRPAFAWAPPMDDPEKLQPDMSGEYHFSFSGSAQVKVGAEASGSITLSKTSYDPRTNLTSGTFTLKKGAPALVILEFNQTRRTARSSGSDGFTDLHVIRPGYPANSKQTFDSAFIAALKPFAYMRFMGWLDTNFQAGYYGDKGHHLIHWNERTLPTDAIQGQAGLRQGTHGIAWENVIELANAVQKDVWINVPISATGSDPSDSESYIYQLAKLFKAKLNPRLHVYIEHSNEVWNFGFSQYIWNKLAAVDEVGQGKSSLNNDGSKDQEQWSRRRHAKRLYEIGKIFEKVYGKGSLNTTIRPVYAAWTIQPQWYSEVLGWMKQTYGDPSKYFYAIGETGYFNDQRAGKTANPAEVVEAMRRDSVAGIGYRRKLKAVANEFGLKLAAYEAGPDNGGGNPTNIGNRILANRSKAMGDLVVEHFRDRMFGEGVDLATYFVLSSAFSRHGAWGATEDYRNLKTAKMTAISKLLGGSVGTTPAVTTRPSSTLAPPTGLIARAFAGGIELRWKPTSGSTSTVWMTSGGNFVVLARNLTGSSYVHRPLKRGGTVTYYVVAQKGREESSPSQQVQATAR